MLLFQKIENIFSYSGLNFPDDKFPENHLFSLTPIMNFKYVKPSGILANYIKYYWVLESDVSEGRIWERVIPTTNIELMFHYKNPFVSQKKSEHAKSQPRSFISGLKNDFVDVATNGDSGVIAVSFHPFGACNFFRFPLLEIEDKSAELSDIDNAGFTPVEEQLCLSRTLHERIALIEQYLLSRFRPVASDDLNLMKEGLRLLDNRNGQLEIYSLSRHLCLSEKSLQRKFNTLIGKSPKKFARIVRFQEIIRCLSENNNRSLTEIAIDNGYFDQAHFIRDFKSLSGYSPKEFLLHYPCLESTNDF